MTELHAPDPMGEAAFDAALFATALGFHLQAARSPTMSREVRAQHAVKAMRQWAPLVRLMVKFAEAAPNAARQAQQAADQHQDWMEAR